MLLIYYPDIHPALITAAPLRVILLRPDPLCVITQNVSHPELFHPSSTLVDMLPLSHCVQYDTSFPRKTSELINTKGKRLSAR